MMVAEPEPPQALSVRKLVLETAKFNVITAHSTAETLELFRLYPNVNMVVLVADHGSELDAHLMTRTVKQVNPRLPVIALSARHGQKVELADHTISSYEPEELVDLVRSILGDPKRDRQPDANTAQDHGA